MGTDIAILLLRVIVGTLLAGHGLQKVTHLLGGTGIPGGSEEFRRDGFRGGAIIAVVAGTTQVGSGFLLIAGFLTPLAATGVVGVMTVAITVKAKNGLWVQQDGYEYPLVLTVIGATIALSGAGRFALDALIGYSHYEPWVGAGASTLGLVGGLLTRWALQTSRPVPASQRK